MNLAIRGMEVSDIPQLQDFWSKTDGMGTNPYDDSEHRLTCYLERNPRTSFIAEVDGKFAGAILCGHDGRRGLIHHTGVISEMRSLGIGSELVRAAVAALKAEEIVKLALFVKCDNGQGNAFWEHRGFYARNDLVTRSYVLDNEHYQNG